MSRVKLVLLSITVLFFLLAPTVKAEDTIKVLMLGGPHDPIPSEDAEHVDDIKGKIFINGRIYQGSLSILKDRNGLHVINTIPIDTYIEVTVAAEVEKDWELEALKAQAVISRTDALFHKNHNAGKTYHISSEVLHTMHDNTIDPLVAYAVKATKDEILTYNDSPINAPYHDTCKGKTELPEEVWEESYPYLKSVSCNSKNAPYENWQRKFSFDEISQALELSRITDIKIIRHTLTGRVKILRLTTETDGTDKSTVEISAMDLRERLGPNELPSTSFTLSKENDNIVFTGNGHGHGVGLSKWGALEMARQGKNYREILAHYYPGTSIHNNDELHHHQFVFNQ